MDVYPAHCQGPIHLPVLMATICMNHVNRLWNKKNEKWGTGRGVAYKYHDIYIREMLDKFTETLVSGVESLAIDKFEWTESWNWNRIENYIFTN